VHPCRFRLGDASTVDVSARVVHCLPRVTPDGTPVYVTGLEFVDAGGSDAQAAAAELVDAVNAAISFDDD
jgi:hypothetical protein